jgi:hypothetical protein
MRVLFPCDLLWVRACFMLCAARKMYHTRSKMLILIAPTDKIDSTEGAKRNTSLFGVQDKLCTCGVSFLTITAPFCFVFYFSGESRRHCSCQKTRCVLPTNRYLRAHTHTYTHVHTFIPMRHADKNDWQSVSIGSKFKYN